MNTDYPLINRSLGYFSHKHFHSAFTSPPYLLVYFFFSFSVLAAKPKMKKTICRVSFISYHVKRWSTLRPQGSPSLLCRVSYYGESIQVNQFQYKILLRYKRNDQKTNANVYILREPDWLILSSNVPITDICISMNIINVSQYIQHMYIFLKNTMQD